MTHQKRTALTITCLLLFVSFSVVFASVTGPAYASQSFTPSITLTSSPCNNTFPPPPPCLVATTTALTFEITFSSDVIGSYIDIDTFTTTDVLLSSSDLSGILVEKNNRFTYHLTVDPNDDRTITLRIPAGAVSDSSGTNTNSAAELTIRVDHRSPTIVIPETYRDGYGGYTQGVQIKQPYVEPNITCVDKVYERGTFVRNDYYDAIPNINVTTDFEPEDLPKLFEVNYSCLDSGQHLVHERLNVRVVEDLSVFNTPPTLLRIERNSPLSEYTDSLTLKYAVFFSKPVVGVDKDDFVLSPGSTGTGTNAARPATSVSAVTQSTYLVTVSAATTGTYNLDLVSSGHNIVDLPNHLLASTTPSGVDQTYTVSTTTTDTTAPTLSSIERFSPASSTTDNQTLIYKAIFSEDVTGVTASDFVLSSGSTGSGSNGNSPVTNISGSGDTYYITVSPSTDGTYNLDLISSGHDIEDAANNPLTNTTPTGADETYTVSTVVTDTTAPRFSSIERYSPSSATTSSQTLIYEVTFSEDVTGVDSADFALSSGSTGSTGAGTSTGQFTQTRSPDIDITEDNTISDTITVTDSGTATSVSLAVDITHTYKGDLKVDLIAPDGTTKTVHNRSGGSIDNIDQTYTPDFAGVSIAGAWTLRINDNYAAADDGTLNSWTLTINHGSGGSTTNPVTTLSGSGSTYYVTVSATQDGTYNLDLISSGHGIEDTADNLLTNTAVTGADETYTVSTVVTDTTAPRFSSIERYSPSSATTSSQTLIYEVTFSEDVTGVDSADFALSSGSTGSTGAGTSTGQFTQTRSPDIDITEDNTISDTITVTDSGTATSVSLAVDITHTYKGDLKVDLIAPDGTTKTVHNRSGGSIDNIDQTYTPDFAGVSIAGAWTLRINDNYAAADDGTLNSWTLTINHGSGGSTTNPVTTLSGSGSTYYVTVSATQDGTYNLDLISSGHGIEDTADNLLTNTAVTGADETYTVSTVVTDITAPRLSSIERFSPASQNTDSQTLIYKTTFSEDVTGVTASDFTLSSGSTGSGSNGNSPVTNISGSGNVYYVTVSPSIDGTYNLDLVSSGHNIEDTSDNPLTNTATTGADETYTVNTIVIDTANPRLSSIERSSPASQNTDSQTLIYKATFSEDVTGVTASDFTLSSSSTGGVSGTAPVTSISGSGSVYYVTVSSTTSGTYNLDLVSSGHNIADTASNPLTNTVPTTGTDQTYTVSITATGTVPTITSIERYYPATEDTNLSTLMFKITFSEDVTGVSTSDFVMSPDSTGGTYDNTNPVAGVAGSGSAYNVILRSQLSGTYNIDLVSSGHNIVDADDNPLTNTTPTTGTDETYTVS